MGAINDSDASNVGDWFFQTNGVVTASPIIEQDVLYCGSSDGVFYALDAKSGKLLWSYKSVGAIRSEALIKEDALIFNAQSNLVALNKTDGTLLWQYPVPVKDSLTSSFDEWDYHASEPILYMGSIYFGDDYGNVHKVNAQDGTGDILFKTESGAAIHSGITIDNHRLYFGDWDGWVYAYDLQKGMRLWSYKCYEDKPYPSYGPIITKPIISKGKLYVGARNYDFKVLNIADGSLAWEYNEPTGGWITGTPLIVNDTLYMGGSDHKAMIAFNALSGSVYWECKSNQNIFCEPLYIKGKIIFVDGDSYNHESGEGYVYVIDSRTGAKIKQISIGRNGYSSPKLKGGYLYFGSYDKRIHAIVLDI